MTNERITIITINFNNSDGLKKTINSIYNQIDKNFEYIIIDGGSTDGSYDVAKSCTVCNKLIYERDKGIYDAMNKGASLATNPYILFINSGDTLRENSVAIYNEVLTNTNCKYDIYHGILAFERDGNILHYRGRKSDLLSKGMVEHPTVLMRKLTFDVLNGFDLKWKYVADYDLLIRAMHAKKSFYFIESIISNFDISGVSSISLRAPLEGLKLQKSHGLISGYEFLVKSGLLKLKGFFYG